VRTLAEWLALQESVHPQAIDMDLTRVAAVARTLSVAAPAFRVLTVGGTNGKGSVVAHAEALLRARGARTGMFTSPHLVRYNERIRIDGVEVQDAVLIGAFERIEAARGPVTLTFFEYNTLAALLVFAERDVEVAVLEVGLGGRLDATNLLAADVAVVVSIGFDHHEWLGDTLESIGREKAGIFRPGRPAVLGSADMPSSVYRAIESLGARPIVAGRDFNWSVEPGGWSYSGLAVTLTGLPPSALAGSIQYRNAATAFAAVEALGMQGLARPLEAVTAGAALRGVRLPGRLQILCGAVEWILDIAHNEPAARVLATHLSERAPLPTPATAGTPRTLAVVGILMDKDAAAVAAALALLIDHWIVCALPGPRGGSAQQLAQRLRLDAGLLTLADSVIAGCETARALALPGDRVVVFGSFHTVGPALQWLRIY
jgi:dihydrofolate synthase/folylpolyglutamate synthase